MGGLFHLFDGLNGGAVDEDVEDVVGMILAEEVLDEGVGMEAGLVLALDPFDGLAGSGSFDGFAGGMVVWSEADVDSHRGFGVWVLEIVNIEVDAAGAVHFVAEGEIEFDGGSLAVEVEDAKGVVGALEALAENRFFVGLFGGATEGEQDWEDKDDGTGRHDFIER